MGDKEQSDKSDEMFDSMVRRARALQSVSRKSRDPWRPGSDEMARKGLRFRNSIRRLIGFALRRPGEICDVDGMIGRGSMALNLCAALVDPLDFVSDEDGFLTGADFAALGVQPALPSLARLILKQGRNPYPGRNGRELPLGNEFREGSTLLLKAECLGKGELNLKCQAPESGDFNSVRAGGIEPFWLAAENPGRVSRDTILFDLDSIVALPRFAALEWEFRSGAEPDATP